MKLRDKVQAVLDSDISGYKLMKDYGINDSKVSQLRKGKSSVDDITLAVTQRFIDAYDKEVNKQ